MDARSRSGAEAGPGRPVEADSAFSERDFYLGEFRGRTLALALPEAAASSVEAVGPVLASLARGGARVVVLAASGSALGALCPAGVVPADHPRLAGEIWRALRARDRAGVALAPGVPFATRCRELVARLGIFKLVWLDPGGGLRARGGQRLSFVHHAELVALLAGGGKGLVSSERIPLWREVVAMLEAGVPAVNVCSAEGLDDELFTYAGSGTLFTRERYVGVRPLGIDDYDMAWDLIGRGVAEGYLAPRGPAQVDAVLAHGLGAFVEGRHLAGIGALLPGGDGRSGEIASLYTLTRFLGEGVGVSLVAFALARARELGYAYVFACTTSDPVGAFFERNGFRAVGPDGVPAEKWRQYDPARRSRVRCYRHELGADAPADGSPPAGAGAGGGL